MYRIDYSAIIEKEKVSSKLMTDTYFNVKKKRLKYFTGYIPGLKKYLKGLKHFSKIGRFIDEELEKTLMSKMNTEKDQTVIVRIPFNLQVQDLVDVLQIGVRNNLKFVIATSPK